MVEERKGEDGAEAGPARAEAPVEPEPGAPQAAAGEGAAAGAGAEGSGAEAAAGAQPAAGAPEEAAAPAPPPPARSARAALAFAVLALLVALGAAAAGGWYAWRETRLEAERAGRTAALAARIEALEGREAALARRLDEALAAAARERAALREALEALARRAGRRAGGWRLAEAEHLVRMAALRLRLARDVEGALAAVEEADAAVRELADPALIPVREALARARAALAAVPRPDVEGMALELAALAERVESLPLAPAYRRAAPPPAAGGGEEAGAEEGPAWRRALARAWQALRSLVVVRRADRPVQPLLAPDEQYFLVLNLRLKLDAARLALLEGREGAFRAALADARRWLGTYFDPEDAAVAAMDAGLARLAGARLSPPLPDLSEALERIRAALAAREGGRPAGAPPAAGAGT
ncbi:MAG TPA: hypothetical protein ENK20_08095 [Chromatiales bacterium]|nr:hypothetical protein [Chromatiales bacterium]